MYDVIIIGAGVVGSAIARKLSQYRLKVAVLEKENDVAMGASKANSGIVHGGYAESHTTLRGQLCFQGRQQMKELNQQLHFDFQEIGSLVVAFDTEGKKKLEELYHNGCAVGLSDLRILEQEELREKEPHLHPKARWGLYCEGAGILSPYGLTIALMENAVANGVALYLQKEVTEIQTLAEGFSITCRGDDTTYESRFIINASGLGGENISRMVGIQEVTLCPRSGQYLLLQAGTGNMVNHVIFQTPSPSSKGVLVAPTYHNNLLIGPDAIQEEENNRNTDVERLYAIFEQAKESVPSLTLAPFLRSFAGVRAAASTGDFIIEHTEVPGFIQAIGIQSPGITAAPAIADRVAELLNAQGLSLETAPGYDGNRQPLSIQETLPSKDVEERLQRPYGAAGRLVCRCEQVPESLMEQVLQRGIHFSSVDGMKRRTRSGMGFCQGGYCRSRTLEVLENTLGKKVPQTTDIEAENIQRVGKQELLEFAAQKEQEEEE